MSYNFFKKKQKTKKVNQIHKVSQFIQTVVTTTFCYKKLMANNSFKRDSILRSIIIYPFPNRFIGYDYESYDKKLVLDRLFGKSIQQHILTTCNYISSIG
jgi:hypothetical protein